MPDHISCDLVVIGGGPAGLAAAVSSASEGLFTTIIAESLGGQAALSPRIENYLGFNDGVTGAELAEIAREQAVKFGANLMVPHLAVRLAGPDNGQHSITLDDGTCIACKSVLLTLGAQYHTLDVPGAQRLTGHGIHYGSALSLAERFRGESVAVVGGANSAAQSVLHLAKYASEVHLLVRGSSLDKMSQYLSERIDATPNITQHFDTEVMAVAGNESVERVLTQGRHDGRVTAIDAAGLFVFIGAKPQTRWLSDTLKLDERGFIDTDASLQTSLSGVFAAGDVRSGSVKRVASASGEGAMAVQHIHQYLADIA